MDAPIVFAQHTLSHWIHILGRQREGLTGRAVCGWLPPEVWSHVWIDRHFDDMGHNELCGDCGRASQVH